MGFKKYFPDVRMGGNKLTADELDAKIHYQITYPSIGTATVWAGLGTGDVAVVGTLVNKTMDYPRNLRWIVTGVAGGEGGTVTITGKDQFGIAQTETIGLATANAGGTKAGTMVFSEVSAVSATVVGLGGTAIGSVALGYALGTAAGQECRFGLPVRIGAVSDVKRLTWIDNGAVTAVNGGTITSDHVFTATHSFMGTKIAAATDIYSVDILSTRLSETDGNIV